MGDNVGRGGAFHLLIGAFLISFSPVFARLSGSATTSVGFYRMLFGLVGLSVMFLFGGKIIKCGPRELLWSSISGLFFSLDIYFWHKSILYVGPGLSTLIANFQVFFLAGLDVFIFRDKLTKRLAVAVILAFSGLYLLAGAGWEGRDDLFKTGVFYGLLTAMMYSGYIFFLRKAGSGPRPIDKRLSMVIVTGVSCLLLGLGVLLSGESFVISDIKTGAYLVSYGVICQAIGWVVIASALPKIKLTIGGLILLLQPALAYVWDVVIFMKAVTPIEITGAVMAMIAIYLGTIRKAVN